MDIIGFLLQMYIILVFDLKFEFSWSLLFVKNYF